jgi:hypothetical protein
MGRLGLLLEFIGFTHFISDLEASGLKNLFSEAENGMIVLGFRK